MRAVKKGIPTILLATIASLAACGRKDAAANNTVPAATSASPTYGAPTGTAADTTPAKHHSKLAGAMVGAAAGHALGGHAIAGAAAGVLIQHERNKHNR